MRVLLIAMLFASTAAVAGESCRPGKPGYKECVEARKLRNADVAAADQSQRTTDEFIEEQKRKRKELRERNPKDFK